MELNRFTPPSFEGICAEILSEVSQKYHSIRYVIEKYRLGKHRKIVMALCLSTLRNYKLLEYALAHCGHNLGGRRDVKYWLALVGAYEAVFRRSKLNKEDIITATRLSRETISCLSKFDPERDIDLKGLQLLSIKYSIPLWVIEVLSKIEVPGGLKALLESFQAPTPIWIRFNKSVLSREEAINELVKAGITTVPDPILDDVLEVKQVKPGALSRIDPKIFYVQDRAAALVAHVVERLSGNMRRVLDLFSAPGNKIAHILWRNTVEYTVSIEISKRRLRDEKHLHKLQDVRLIEYVQSDATKPPLRTSYFDVVVVDPDCTSIGRLGHSPETRLFLEDAGPQIVSKLVRLQQKALREALKVVKPGGVVVYTTCTLTIEENENVVSSVAREFSYDIERVEPLIGVKGLIEGTQRLYPHISKCTGGFVSAIRALKR